jgi:membrane-bound serine protease (ClpP class)
LALVAGFVLFALIDPPLGVICLVAGALFEVVEATFWYRYLKRIRVQTGVEGMVGRRAEVIEPCHPRGRVKLDGEIWNAECAAGAEVGETVEVIEVERLTLVVRPAGGAEAQRR